MKPLSGFAVLALIVTSLLPMSDAGAQARPAAPQAPPAATQAPPAATQAPPAAAQPAPAGQQPPPGGVQAPPAPKAPPAPIPVAEVWARANEVAAYVRTLDHNLELSAPIAGIERALPGLSGRLDDRSKRTRATLESTARLGELDGLVDAWQSSRVGLVAWTDTLTARAVWLEQQRQQLTALSETWTRTRKEAARQRAPWPVVAKTDEVLFSIASVSKRLDAQHAAILNLQDRVAKELALCDEALDKIAQARRQATGQLFVRDSPPVWQLRPRSLTELPGVIVTSFEAHGAILGQFVRDQYERIVVHILLLLVLVAVIWWTRRRARERAAEGQSVPTLATIFEHPVAAAAVLAALATPWIYSDMPRTGWLLLEAGALVPMLMIFRRLVAPALAPGVYGLAAFFLVDRLRELFTAFPVLERVTFLFELLVAAALLGWLLWSRRGREVPASDVAVVTRVLPTLLRIAFAVLVVAFVSGVVGNMNLARWLGSSALDSAYTGLILAAGRRIAEGLFDFALSLPPLRLLRMVQTHRALIERRAHNLLRTLSVAVWLAATFDAFGLLRPAVAGARRILDAEVGRGALHISVGDVLAFGITVWAAFFVSSLVRFVLEEDVFPRLALGPGLPYALSSLVSYALVTVGFIVALLVLGVNLDRVTVLGGAFGVGIGFGLQNVVNNFVSGLIVLFERPVHIGDEVQIGNVQGQVRRIGFRSTTIRMGEGAEVIVPNSQLVAERVTNWTPVRRLRRLDISVNVVYGTAPDAVLKVLAGVAQAHSDITGQPPPQALFLGFGESSLRFELRAWTHRLDDPLGVKSDLGISVYTALREAGMGIALPQQEVHIRRE